MQLTSNTRPFIESEQYSQFILMNLDDGLLPGTFYRNVADFMSGDTLHIKTVGEVTLQEAAENTPLNYNPIESGEITFRITDYIGDAWFITDELREDGTQIDQLMAERAAASTRAIQERFESDLLKTAAEVYSATSEPFNVNGFPHKIVSAATNGIFQLEHLNLMKLSFDKANVPSEGRVFICDPIVRTTLSNLITITSDVTPFAEAILQNGLGRGQSFVMELFGWSIITSNRLHVAAANDGTTSLGSATYNLCMCVVDDQTKPMMAAWRRMPKSEGERNKDNGRDEHIVKARYGIGVQRINTLGTICTSPTAYK